MRCIFLNSSINCIVHIDILPLSTSPSSLTIIPTTSFQLVISSDNKCIYTKVIDTDAVFKSEGDSSIVFFNDSIIDFSLTFCNSVFHTYVLSLLTTIKNGETSSLLAMPTINTIELLRMYLHSFHPIARHLIKYCVSRQGYIDALYDVFVTAELCQQYNILHIFYHIMIALFHLKSDTVLSILLNPCNILHTIACLEYSEISSTYQNANRDFLNQIKMHSVLSLSDSFKTLARTNYYIKYIKKTILETPFSPTNDIVDKIIIRNNCNMMKILFADKHFAKKTIMSLVPIMVSVNDKLILCAEPNESSLKFVKELLSLDVSESIKNRLIHKLCAAGLLEFLNMILLASSNIGIIDILLELYRVAPSRIYDYITLPESKMIHTIIALINRNDESGRFMDFLQTIIPKVTLTSTPSEYGKTFITTYLPNIIKSLYKTTNIENQRRIYEFIGQLFQSYPIICRSYFNRCVTLFITLTDQLLIDIDFISQKKLLHISSSQLLYTIISISDDFFIRTLMSRSGFIESIMTIFLANRSDNLLGSVLQRIVCKMVEQWLTTFMKTRVCKMIESIPHKTVVHVLEQIIFAITSAITNIGASLIANDPIVKKPIPLLRYDSLEPYKDKYNDSLDNSHHRPSTVPLPRQLAIQQIMFLLSRKIQREKTAVIRHWKSYTTPREEPNQYFINAVYFISHKLTTTQQNTMKFVLRRHIIPIMRRFHLREALYEWKKRAPYHAKHEIKRNDLINYPSNDCNDDSINYPSGFPNDDHIYYSNSSSRSSIGYGSASRTNSGIGEQIDIHANRKDEDNFYLIQSFKKESMHFKQTPSTPNFKFFNINK